MSMTLSSVAGAVGLPVVTLLIPRELLIRVRPTSCSRFSSNPGVFQFYKELDMGTNPDYTALPHPSANLVFITSRPCPKGEL